MLIVPALYTKIFLFRKKNAVTTLGDKKFQLIIRPSEAVVFFIVASWVILVIVLFQNHCNAPLITYPS